MKLRRQYLKQPSYLEYCSERKATDIFFSNSYYWINGVIFEKKNYKTKKGTPRGNFSTIIFYPKTVILDSEPFNSQILAKIDAAKVVEKRQM